MDLTLTGLEFPKVTFRPEERLSVPLVARVIGESDPRFLSTPAAQAAGYAGRLLPLTMLFFVQTITESDLLERLDVRYGRTLFAGFDWEWHQVATEQDLISGQTTVTDVTEKSGRDGTRRIFATLETRFTDAQDRPISTARFHFIDRPDMPA